MAKYSLSEIGYVATDFKRDHNVTFEKLALDASKEMGAEIKSSAFREMRRSDRGYEMHRKVLMDYMRKHDPALVEASLIAYNKVCTSK